MEVWRKLLVLFLCRSVVVEGLKQDWGKAVHWKSAVLWGFVQSGVFLCGLHWFKY